MGTNLYWAAADLLPPEDDWDTYDDPRVHLGKRSAAGLYCWDCRQTFCLDGEAGIHETGACWATRCPRCGQAEPPQAAGTFGLATSVELGFAQPPTEPPTGVGTAASWSWAQCPERVRAICASRPDEVLIEDQYGQRYTGRAFLAMLAAQCPLEYRHSIGERFS